MSVRKIRITDHLGRDVHLEETKQPQLDPAEALRREVYTKEGKSGTTVRKVVTWKTNKHGADDLYPPYVAFFTDYSAARKEPLKTSLRIASTLEKIDKIADQWLAENIKRGWNCVSRDLIDQSNIIHQEVGQTHSEAPTKPLSLPKAVEKTVKGFVMDDERLKEGRNIGADYFDELLERIRDIRASEKRFYQKIRDIYKLACDYDPGAEETLEFFKIVQNKLHWAVTGHTAAELIAARADSGEPNMGLTSWKGAKVRKGDVVIAKNYLHSDEIEEFNRIVVMYLDYAEDQARRRRPLYMRDWRKKLNAFLKFNERDILEHAGKVSMEVAKELALSQYERFEHHRLAEEAEQEALEDDAALARVAKMIEEKPGKGKKGKKE